MKKLIHKISEAFRQLGQAIAVKLGNHVNPLASTVKRRALIVTGLLIGITITLLIRHSFNNNMFTQWPQDSITRPVDVRPQDTTNTEAEIIRQFNALFEFNALLDTLDSITADTLPVTPYQPMDSLPTTLD